MASEINTFALDFSNGSWTTLAPSDGTHFAAEVPQLDQAALCGGDRRSSFQLAAVGSWPEAPLPGELDDDHQASPSCSSPAAATA